MARVVDFTELPSVNIERSHIKRNFSHKTTFNEGEIIPIVVDEVLPSDTLTMDIAGLVREVTPLFPVMDDAILSVDTFFVPNRLVWTNWEKFCGETEPSAWITPKTYTIPTFNPSTLAATLGMDLFNRGSLYDHLGLPISRTGVAGGLPRRSISALPFRGYQLIYNNYYRDENLQESIPITVNDNIGTFSYIGTLRKSCRLHDYFSSCLPAPQKGLSSTIPLSGYAPVAGRTVENIGGTPVWIPESMLTYGNNVFFGTPTNKDEGAVLQLGIHSANGTYATGGTMYTKNIEAGAVNSSAQNVIGEGSFVNLWANLDEATASFTVNDMRNAIAIQRLLELDARGGTRYRELVKSHFGCETGDARVQVPEYLGHYQTSLNMNQVIQTSGTTETSPLGQTGANSKTVFQGNGIIRKTFVEHGYIYVLVTVRVARTYTQGISKLWTRSDKYDFYWPALANIGEQPVYTEEIYGLLATSDYSTGDTPKVFGYQEAWSSYRYRPNSASGYFVPTNSDSGLSAWTYADTYGAAPTLSSGWMTEGTTNIDNTIAVQSELGHQFFADFAFNCDWYRPMPLYSVPSLEAFI